MDVRPPAPRRSGGRSPTVPAAGCEAGRPAPPDPDEIALATHPVEKGVEDIQALALADAVGALDSDGRRELEARLTAVPADVRAEVAHLYDASVDIPSSVIGEVPSPMVRGALLARIAVPSNHTITADEGTWLETPQQPTGSASGREGESGRRQCFQKYPANAATMR